MRPLPKPNGHRGAAAQVRGTRKGLGVRRDAAQVRRMREEGLARGRGGRGGDRALRGRRGGDAA